MSYFSTLRRSTQRFQIPHSSSLLHRKSLFAIVTGTTLGLLLYSEFDLKTSLPSFIDSSPPTSSTEDQKRRRSSSTSFFQKFSLPETSGGFLLGDAFRRKVFFNYEKRIRLRSPPEKVFEYFASCRTPKGEVLMIPADLMRAVVPVFPPSESHLVREGYLRGERSPGHLRCPPSEFFMLFDTNNDGHISFKEYIFFVTLLSIPESSFSVAFKMFDVDNDGGINFKAMQIVAL